MQFDSILLRVEHPSKRLSILTNPDTVYQLSVYEIDYEILHINVEEKEE